jgi:hypothetical protein
MPKDEFVYVGHMLDKAHEALSLVRERPVKITIATPPSA